MIQKELQVISTSYHNFRHNLLISPNGLERLIANNSAAHENFFQKIIQAGIYENMWRKWRKWRKLLRHSATSATSAMLRNQEWSIDFQGENSKKWISTDFLRRYENVFAGSPWEKRTWSQLIDFQYHQFNFLN